MSDPTWYGDPPPRDRGIGLHGWWRVAWRGALLGAVNFGGLALLLLIRLVERPLCGLHRPVTPYITQFVCKSAFRIMGIGFVSRGTPMDGPGAAVANHGSWLDIFALNARKRIYFVAKAEVAGWPGIGWLARATGTVFIERDRKHAAAQRQVFLDRLAAGHRLMFFPEGTSTDGRRVLPFKPTLFAAFFDAYAAEHMQIQPVSVVYHPPEGEDPRFYGWWGDMDFGAHLLKVLAVRRQGSVEVIYHPPLSVTAMNDRKRLARAAEDQVRAGVAAALSDKGP